ALCVDRAAIIGDLNEAIACIYNQNGGAIEPFQITMDAERVRVHASNEYQRPTRLNAKDALVLGLGLRVLASEAEVERRAQILALAEGLERDLAAPEIELQPALHDHIVAQERASYGAELTVAVGEDDFRSVFAEAIEQRRVCVVEYMKPRAAPGLREVLPQRLIYGNGHWYVAGIDVERGESRTFRLDRVISVDVTEKRIEAAGVSEQLSIYAADQHDEIEARVRYSPRVARWIAEQNGGQLEVDGSIVVVHRVADPDWLVRHVLQYGGEAVVETPELRRVVAERAAALCA
ncbi:MAG TPA: WYL domain-containing protein, partial [Longimicrobiales bacterium]